MARPVLGGGRRDGEQVEPLAVQPAPGRVGVGEGPARGQQCRATIPAEREGHVHGRAGRAAVVVEQAGQRRLPVAVGVVNCRQVAGVATDQVVQLVPAVDRLGDQMHAGQPVQQPGDLVRRAVGERRRGGGVGVGAGVQADDPERALLVGVEAPVRQGERGGDAAVGVVECGEPGSAGDRLPGAGCRRCRRRRLPVSGVPNPSTSPGAPAGVAAVKGQPGRRAVFGVGAGRVLATDRRGTGTVRYTAATRGVGAHWDRLDRRESRLTASCSTVGALRASAAQSAFRMMTWADRRFRTPPTDNTENQENTEPDMMGLPPYAEPNPPSSTAGPEHRTANCRRQFSIFFFLDRSDRRQHRPHCSGAGPDDCYGIPTDRFGTARYTVIAKPSGRPR